MELRVLPALLLVPLVSLALAQAPGAPAAAASVAPPAASPAASRSGKEQPAPVAASPKHQGSPASDLPPDQQADLNCKTFGLAGGMLAADRDAGMSQQAAVADVRGNFERLDVAKPHNRVARDYALVSLEGEAKSVYERPALKPKTLLYALPLACLASMSGQTDDRHVKSFLDGGARTCQDRQPPPLPSQDLATRDHPSEVLQGCMVKMVPFLFDK